MITCLEHVEPDNVKPAGQEYAEPVADWVFVTCCEHVEPLRV